MKDSKTKAIQKKTSAPLITEKRLQANRELLIGQKIKRFFLGYGSAIGTVKRSSVSNDAYYLTYSAMMVTMTGFLRCPEVGNDMKQITL